MAHVPSFEMPREEIKRELDRIRHPMRVVVDRAKNPFNIGSIIRTAHSFLPKEIVLVGTEPWYERAAMGMHRYENIREIESVERMLEVAEEEGWKLSCFEKDEASVSLWEAALPEDAALVFGNENTGIDPRILARAAETIAIPMYGINHSYPISVAAGMGLAEWARRRYQHGRVVLPQP